MQFVEKLINLQETYQSESATQTNGTKLVGLSAQTPPLAKHYIYAPMDQEVRKHLIESYKRNFPEQLLCLYEAANGCDLFWKCIEIGVRKIKIPVSQLSVYGVPGNAKSVECLAPYNISLEDLDRPDGTPENWLKFGSYRIIAHSQVKSAEFDLFTDVDDGQVYSVKRKAEMCKIEQSWASIDDCLCELFNTLIKLQ